MIKDKIKTTLPLDIYHQWGIKCKLWPEGVGSVKAMLLSKSDGVYSLYGGNFTMSNNMVEVNTVRLRHAIVDCSYIVTKLGIWHLD